MSLFSLDVLALVLGPIPSIGSFEALSVTHKHHPLNHLVSPQIDIWIHLRA